MDTYLTTFEKHVIHRCRDIAINLVFHDSFISHDKSSSRSDLSSRRSPPISLTCLRRDSNCATVSFNSNCASVSFSFFRAISVVASKTMSLLKSANAPLRTSNAPIRFTTRIGAHLLVRVTPAIASSKGIWGFCRTARVLRARRSELSVVKA